MKSRSTYSVFPILVLFLLLFPVAGSTAESPPDEANSGQIFLKEVSAILDAQKAALDGLYVRFDEAADETEAVAIEREIQVLHRKTEIDVREASLRHARRLGMTRLAERLAAEIQDLKDPDRRRNLYDPDNSRQ